MLGGVTPVSTLPTVGFGDRMVTARDLRPRRGVKARVALATRAARLIGAAKLLQDPLETKRITSIVRSNHEAFMQQLRGDGSAPLAPAVPYLYRPPTLPEPSRASHRH